MKTFYQINHFASRQNIKFFLLLQDGFISIADGKSVLESYNGVYHLGITQARMAELLRLSSNGNYVNIEEIMRLLITSSQNA